mmetsp:Transcript_102032/g.263780  ORF Transcript_102032/g.263780 Transcript_102032/m.263780 type:complete len:244 (-) Transcript_102032:33-764(-)
MNITLRRQASHRPLWRHGNSTTSEGAVQQIWHTLSGSTSSTAISTRRCGAVWQRRTLRALLPRGDSGVGTCSTMCVSFTSSESSGPATQRSECSELAPSPRPPVMRSQRGFSLLPLILDDRAASGRASATGVQSVLATAPTECRSFLTAVGEQGTAAETALLPLPPPRKPRRPASELRRAGREDTAGALTWRWSWLNAAGLSATTGALTCRCSGRANSSSASGWRSQPGDIVGRSGCCAARAV